jgi:hypothetical protein
MIALQNMLLQATGDTIFLLPAWPEKWEVEFKLHTPGNSFIEGRYSSGKGMKIISKNTPGTTRILNYMNGS